MKFFRSVVERPWPERLRTPPGPPGTLRCTVLKGRSIPPNETDAAGAVLTQFPGGAGESVGNGLSVASGSEKSTVTLVSKAAPAVPVPVRPT